MDWLKRVVVRVLLVSLWTVSLSALVYPARAQAQGGGVHTVAAGETLSQIARDYGISVATLLELNDLSNANLVHVGQQLVVSEGGGGGEEPSRQTRWADDKPANNGPSSHEQDSGWDSQPSSQPYQRAGVAWSPDAGQGAQRPGVSWEPQSDDDAEEWSDDTPTYRTQASAYEDEEEGAWEDSRTQPKPYLSEWESVHSGRSVPGSSWEPEPGQPGAQRSREEELTGEKWIDVDISEQTLIAYVGDVAVRTFIISTGSSRYPTVTGSFRTYARTELQDMSGGSVAAGDYYYQPDVPWVQYFFEGYALHGAWWHNSFGSPIGHGCVNMRVGDSQWLYEWTGVTGIRVEVHQ